VNMDDAGVSIFVRVESSRIMLVFLISVHLVALVALWLADLTILMSAALTLAVLCYGVYSFGRFYSLAHGMSVHSLRLEGTDWNLELPNARHVRVSLVNEIVILSWFAALQFQEIDGRKKYSVALFKDSADQDALRRLRTWLKHGMSKV
jgi:hypothetical protein